MGNATQISTYSRNGVLLLKLAVLYLLIGLFIGLGMSISGQFHLGPVHAHVNLLGWATLALTGMIYCLFPQMATTRLANWHVWLHNLGLPVMMTGLTFYLLGNKAIEPVIAIGSLMTISGLFLFAINFYKNVFTTESIRTDLNQPVTNET